MFRNRLSLWRAISFAALAGGSTLLHAAQNQLETELNVSEQFVDAFYSFDPQVLRPLLYAAGESQQEILFYQGWAQGGNYVVVKREPCAKLTEDTISCSITVEDDLVLALGIDFDVTDTFTISFENGEIKAVATSSNDPEIYHNARDWTLENRSELVKPYCSGTEQGEANPHKCVRGMLQGYSEYARLNKLTPREGTGKLKR